MKLLHTSDWHLGRSLFDRKRSDEFTALIDWMLDLIALEHIDAVLISGDVFDTGIPGTHAQSLYYDFLARAARAGCRHIVVIAGNHDSPSFLSAPRDILRHLNIHVFGAMSAQSPADDVILLHAPDGRPELIVCAIPYLRDRDIRSSIPGETAQDKDRHLVEGIVQRYTDVIDAGEHLREGLSGRVPIVLMGHLFATGGRTIDGDGVRELYVGSLARVGSEIFPPSVDYAALGHLHQAQCLEGNTTRRYSGAPLPMSFDEAKTAKSVAIVEFMGGTVHVQLREIPRFQELIRISGELRDILGEIAILIDRGSRAWLEIDYTGQAIEGSLAARIDEAVAGSALAVLRIRNRAIIRNALTARGLTETLDDLDPGQVFDRCLDANDIAPDQRAELIAAHNEILQSLRETDGESITPPAGNEQETPHAD